MSAAAKKQQITNESLLHDKQLIYAFVEGTIKTFSDTANTEIVNQKPFVEKQYQKRGNIAGVLRIIAPPLTGRLIVSFPEEVILQVMENMLGEKPSALDKDVADAVGELTNQIYGQAKTTLSDLGYQFEMSIPNVSAERLEVPNPDYFASLVMPFTLANNAVFYVEINIE